MRHTETVGVVSEDDVTGLTLIPEPVGVVCRITPATNLLQQQSLNIDFLKTELLVLPPHPSAQNHLLMRHRSLRDAAIAAGAPENVCVQWITQPSVEATSAL